MVCSLNCFCDFLEAKTPERRTAVVKRYKKTSIAPIKGMSVYYQPVLRLIRGTLCPDGTLDQKYAALRDACINPTSTDKLNDARIASNTRVFKAFCSEFGNRTLSVFSNPRMQFIACEDVAVNLQPELHAEVDGVRMMWKFGLKKRSRSDGAIRAILQMLARASKHKGIELPIQQVRFLDTMTGKTYAESTADLSIEKDLRQKARLLAEVWDLPFE